MYIVFSGWNVGSPVCVYCGYCYNRCFYQDVFATEISRLILNHVVLEIFFLFKIFISILFKYKMIFFFFLRLNYSGQEIVEN